MISINRNVESHFASLPSVNIERSTFDTSRNVKTSFSCGSLIPFFCSEVLPGDTFDVSTSKVIRSQTMLTPFYGDLVCDTFYFFCPNRLVWDHWEEFCGENKESAWAPTTEYTMPTIIPPEGGFAVNTLADYFGLPLGIEWKGDDELAPMVLPFRMYAKIVDEFFRDENLTDPLLIPTDDANQFGSNGDNYITDVANGGKPFVVAKLHDYFTSCLPSPQKGPAVGIPIDVPVFSGGVFPVTTGRNVSEDATMYPMVVKTLQTPSGTSNDFNDLRLRAVNATANGYWNQSTQTPASGAMSISTVNPLSGYYGIAPANLQVDIPSDVSGGSVQAEFSVNELRLAFAYQRFLEALARSGSRYTEILLGLFNTHSPDARLQRPEYLGGNRVPLNVTEVTNVAQTSTDFLGDVAAKSQTNDRNHSFIKSFTEHGFVIGLMCIRYEHSTSQAIEKFWTRKKFTDFYNPKFAHLGEMPVYQAELYATADNMVDRTKIFGYQEAWAEYRYGRNMVTGEMRPGVANSLSYWNLADHYDEPPYLSDEWIREDPGNLDRVLAVSHDVANQFWVDILVNCKCTRPMPLYSVPGLIDHF